MAAEKPLSWPGEEPLERSSRLRAEDAGWGDGFETGQWEQRLEHLRNRRWRDFSWLTTRALLDSANDQIAKLIHDLVDARRARWMASQRAAGVLNEFKDLVIKPPTPTPARRCLILGDPGEADGSQYAVVEPMLSVHRELETDFMVILSDVIYPAGDVNDYVNAFYEAYSEYDKPILALPGNHDWYDGLNGFMFHFCGAEALPPTEFRRTSYRAPERVARRLWRQADRPHRPLLRAHRSRLDPNWKPPQPGPYWALDMDGVRLVAIDTGIKGAIDREQAEWLLRVSAEPGPKVLLTGKPLWVDGRPKDTPIDWGDGGPASMSGVDDIVRHADFEYVAAIGGDVHNYQRLTVRTPAWPEGFEYIVAGGSGAYMSATHRIEKLDGRIERFRCYPTRGDSLAYYSRTFGKRAVHARLVSALVLLAALGGAGAWLAGGGLGGGPGLLAVMGVGVAGAIVVPLVLGLAGFAAYRVFPRGFKTVAVLMSLAALALLAVALARDVLEGDAWVWETALSGVGVLLAPIFAVLAGYYGFRSERAMKRTLTASVAIVATVLVVAPLAVTLYTIVVALACVMVLFGVFGAVQGRTKDVPPAMLSGPARWLHDARRSAWLWTPATVLLYGAIPVALLVHFEQERVLATALALVIVLSALALLVIAGGGGLALNAVAKRGLDADMALAYLYDRHGIVETLPDGDRPARTRTPPDEHAKAVCELLLPGTKNPLRKALTARVTEIGNADDPPMFKSFLSLEVEDGHVVVRCYGATGWAEHEDVVPVEDVVRIPLSRAPVPPRGGPARARRHRTS